MRGTTAIRRSCTRLAFSYDFPLDVSVYGRGLVQWPLGCSENFASSGERSDGSMLLILPLSLFYLKLGEQIELPACILPFFSLYLHHGIDVALCWSLGLHGS